MLLLSSQNTNYSFPTRFTGPMSPNHTLMASQFPSSQALSDLIGVKTTPIPSR